MKYTFDVLVVAMVSHIPAKSRMAVNYVIWFQLGSGKSSPLGLKRELPLHTRKRGVHLYSETSFLYTLGKEGSIVLGRELPLHTRKTGACLASGKRFCYTLRKEESVSTRERVSFMVRKASFLILEKSLSVTLRGSYSCSSCRRWNIEWKPYFPTMRDSSPLNFWGSVLHLLIPLPHLHIGVAWSKVQCMVGNWVWVSPGQKTNRRRIKKYGIEGQESADTNGKEFTLKKRASVEIESKTLRNKTNQS